jgi:hypothetical protein
MWFLRKPPETVECFFCKLSIKKEESFKLQYKAADGIGEVTMCPMCSGMINDMAVTMRGDDD